jgi:hypothetical protein
MHFLSAILLAVAAFLGVQADIVIRAGGCDLGYNHYQDQAQVPLVDETPNPTATAVIQTPIPPPSQCKWTSVSGQPTPVVRMGQFPQGGTADCYGAQRILPPTKLSMSANICVVPKDKKRWPFSQAGVSDAINTAVRCPNSTCPCTYQNLRFPRIAQTQIIIPPPPAGSTDCIFPLAVQASNGIIPW